MASLSYRLQVEKPQLGHIRQCAPSSVAPQSGQMPAAIYCSTSSASVMRDQPLDTSCAMFYFQFLVFTLFRHRDYISALLQAFERFCCPSLR